MSHLPTVELRDDGRRPQLLIDGHVIRGVTQVSLTREVHGPVRVTVELITDRLTSTAVAPAGTPIPVDSPEAMEQRSILAEIRAREEGTALEEIGRSPRPTPGAGPSSARKGSLMRAAGRARSSR